MRSADLNTRALEIEALLTGRLHDLATRFPAIGEVRGRGAMIAIELVKPGSKEPNPEVTAAVAKACHAEGLVVLTAGTYGNVLRFLPPLVMPEHLLTEGLDIIEGAFAGVSLEGAKIQQDDDSTVAIYGKMIDQKETLGGATPAPAVAEPFLKAVADAVASAGK